MNYMIESRGIMTVLTCDSIPSAIVEYNEGLAWLSDLVNLLCNLELSYGKLIYAGVRGMTLLLDSGMEFRKGREKDWRKREIETRDCKPTSYTSPPLSRPCPMRPKRRKNSVNSGVKYYEIGERYVAQHVIACRHNIVAAGKKLICYLPKCIIIRCKSSLQNRTQTFVTFVTLALRPFTQKQGRAIWQANMWFLNLLFGSMWRYPRNSLNSDSKPLSFWNRKIYLLNPTLW